MIYEQLYKVISVGIEIHQILLQQYVDLRIKSGSAAVNTANRTWAGHTFRSITFI